MNTIIKNKQRTTINIWHLVYLIFVVMVAGCNRNEENGSINHEKKLEHSEESGHSGSHETSLTLEQIKTIGIQFGSIERKQLTASLKANGILKVPNQNRANITAMAGGVIKSILVQPGNTVIKGQVIATLSGTSFITMQEEYISINSQLQLSEIEFNRQKELSEGNASALKTYQKAEADLRMLRARKESLQKQLELIGLNSSTVSNGNISSFVNLTSPINGSVSDVLVNIGTFVEANNPVATIVDNSQLHVDLYVYEKDLLKLHEGQIIHFTLTNNPGKEYDAKIYGIGNTFEANTKAVAVHAQVLGNKEGLIDGMSITALVSLSSATVESVPTEAIVNHEGQDYIFVVSSMDDEKSGTSLKENDSVHSHEGEKGDLEHSHNENSNVDTHAGSVIFERIPVVKGTTDIGYSEITVLSKIHPDSKIVIKGAYFILGKMTYSGEAHEH